MPAPNSMAKHKSDLAGLIALGQTMLDDIVLQGPYGRGELDDEEITRYEKAEGSFQRDYQRWFTEALATMGHLLPRRSAECTHLYLPDPKRKRITPSTYSIQDWMRGIGVPGRLDDSSFLIQLFRTQLGILESVEVRFESSLFDIMALVQADLFDSELETAGELLSRGFVRAAGAVAGVVLERHLAGVADNHNVLSPKTNPTIGDFNDLLKNSGVLDVPSWRQIQRLSDIRNRCVHNKDREPSIEDVQDLIDGVEKYAKSLF